MKKYSIRVKFSRKNCFNSVEDSMRFAEIWANDAEEAKGIFLVQVTKNEPDMIMIKGVKVKEL